MQLLNTKNARHNEVQHADDKRRHHADHGESGDKIPAIHP
jgi:hypothetical protein